MIRLNLRFCMLLLCSILASHVVAIGGARLGDGYKSATGATTDTCLVAAEGGIWKQNMEMNNPQGSLELTQVTSNEELAKLLNISGSVGASAGGWGAEVGGGFLDQSANSSKTISIVYAQQFKQTATLNLKLAQYSSDWMAARNSIISPYDSYYLGSKGSGGPLAFYNRCGNAYISSVSAGGLLVVVITIQFTSSEAKNEFNAAIKASGNVSGVSVGLSASLGMAEQYAKSGTSVSIKAQQFGGYPMKLQDATLGSPDSSGAYQIQKCGSVDSKEPRKCDKLVDNIIQYASTFSGQFRESGQIVKDRLFYSEPIYNEYKNVFGQDANISVESQEAILTELRENYNNLQLDIALINEYQSLIKDTFVSNAAGMISKVPVLPPLIAYKTDILMPNKKVYDQNAELKTCFQNTTGCNEAKTVIANSQITATKRQHVAGAAYLDYIRENSFMISNILTLDSLADPQKPTFRYVNCNLIPVKKDTGAWTNIITGCPGINSGYPTLKYGMSPEGDTIEMEQFTYNIKQDGQEYRITYPKTTLYNLKFSDYAPANEGNFPVVKYEKCDMNLNCTAMGEIVGSQVKNFRGSNAFYLELEELVNVYPDLMY